MKKFTFFKNISLIVALVAIVYFVSHYAGFAQSELMKMFNIPGSSVAGASTKKAEEISEKIKSDVEGQLGILQKQALSLTIGDAINSLSRLQKVQKDFNSLKDYTEEKVNDVLESKSSQKSKVKNQN